MCADPPTNEKRRPGGAARFENVDKCCGVRGSTGVSTPTTASHANPKPIRLRSRKPLRRDTLRGFASITAPSLGQEIDDIAVHMLGTCRWVSLPARRMLDPKGKPLRDAKGKIRYVSPVRWITLGLAARFSEWVIQLVLEQHPGALDDGGGATLGAEAESFKYKKHLGVTRNGLPYAIEAAFAYCPDEDWRQLVTGVNFSVGVGNSFTRLGPFDSLSAVLGRQHVAVDDPVVIALHYACPRVEFADRGKWTLALPSEVTRHIVELIEVITSDWAKRRRAEMRRASAEANRRERLLREKRRPARETPP
jgi:hypothetical protein